jgi:hypothetical protein
MFAPLPYLPPCCIITPQSHPLISRGANPTCVQEPVEKLNLASSGLFSVWTASGSIDDTTNIDCFAILARRKNARSRANDGVFR